jgi:hypothetical protein
MEYGYKSLIYMNKTKCKNNKQDVLYILYKT